MFSWHLNLCFEKHASKLSIKASDSSDILVSFSAAPFALWMHMRRDWMGSKQYGLQNLEVPVLPESIVFHDLNEPNYIEMSIIVTYCKYAK